MRVLLIADSGDGLLDLALRAQRAGHQIKLFVRKFDAQTRPIGKGLVERVPDWRDWIRWADITVLEGNGVYMAEMEAWAKRGWPIIGGSPASAAWELDRAKGMQIFKHAGIAVPPFREFNDYVEAINYVDRRGEVFYSKPCSDTADKSLSAKTGIPEDPSWMLRKWKKKHGRPPCPFLLQEAIEGIEMGVGGWWGPGGWADAWEENWEHKRFCAGDVGPNTGEMGTVLRFVRRSKLADQLLVPLEDQLARLGPIAVNVDVNAIIDAAGQAWPLEFTMRLGWPSFNIETDLFDGDPVEFVANVAAGGDTRGAHFLDRIGVGVVVALPPYPYPPRDYDDIVGYPVYGLDDDDHWHPCEIQSHAQRMMTVAANANSRPKTNETAMSTRFATAGSYLGIACGVSATVRQAQRAAYKLCDKLSMPGSPFWRVDIGDRLEAELPQLQAHGFARGME